MMVLSLCDRTGNMLKPWARAGYECIGVDVQHDGERIEDGIRYVGADVRHYIPPQGTYAAVFAFPPCTNLAVSGARWFRSKGLRGLIDGLELVERCRVICEWSEAPWMLENPVSTLSTYWRPPDYLWDPCEFGGYLNPPGDMYTKRTCLWVGNGFTLPPRRPVQPLLGSVMHLLPPTPDRGDLRSETPMGFAEAVFQHMTTHQQEAHHG